MLTKLLLGSLLAGATLATPSTHFTSERAGRTSTVVAGPFSAGAFTTGWTITVKKKVDTSGAPSPVAGYSLPSTGGNPNDYCEDTIEFPSWIGGRYAARAVVLAVNENAYWDPTNTPTAFEKIEYNRDEKEFGTEHAHQAMIYQDGEYYLATNNVVIGWNGGIWVSPNTDTLVATDFGKLDQNTLLINWSAHPNFTNGARMYFGWAFYGDRTIGGTMTDGHEGIDNWGITVYRL